MVKQCNEWSLVGLGCVQSTSVEIDRLQNKNDRWSLTLSQPPIYIDFVIIEPLNLVQKWRLFLHKHRHSQQFEELLLGYFGKSPVHLVSENDSSKRFYLKIAGGVGGFAQYTLNHNNVSELIKTLEQVEQDLCNDS